MRNLVVAFVALALLPASAYAGGGTKGASSKVTVNNHGSDRLAVILDAPANFDPKKNTVSQFTAAGGKIIEGGGSLTIQVKEGKHQFGAAYVSSAGVIGKNFTQNYNVPKNNTILVDVVGDYPSTPTVVVTPSK